MAESLSYSPAERPEDLTSAEIDDALDRLISGETVSESELHALRVLRPEVFLEEDK